MKISAVLLTAFAAANAQLRGFGVDSEGRALATCANPSGATCLDPCTQAQVRTTPELQFCTAITRAHYACRAATARRLSSLEPLAVFRALNCAPQVVYQQGQPTCVKNASGAVCTTVVWKRDGTAMCADPCRSDQVVYDANGVPSCPLRPAVGSTSTQPCGRVAYKRDGSTVCMGTCTTIAYDRAGMPSCQDPCNSSEVVYSAEGAPSCGKRSSTV